MVERGVAGEPGYNMARGKPGEDGSLILTGTGIAQRKDRPHGVLFEGRLEGERFVLKGYQGSRACTLVLARR